MLLESGRKIIIHGASAAIATKKAKDLQTLCQDNYYALNVVEEAERNVNVKKDPVQCYPTRGVLLVRRPSTSLKGRIDIKGQKWDENPQEFELWTDQPPANMPILQ